MVDRENLTSVTDAEIVDRIVNGEDELFSLLYERNFDKVYNKCLGMTHNSETAKDLAQEVFLKALEAIKTYRGDAKFSTWIYAITYNLCIEYLRKNKRIRFNDWEDILDLPEETVDAELNEIMELKRERIILLLEFLKPEDKATIILKYWEGMDLERIMYILSVENVDVLKTRLYRARRRLRAIYVKFENVL